MAPLNRLSILSNIPVSGTTGTDFCHDSRPWRPTRPISGYRHVHPENHDASLPDRAAALASASFHMDERLWERPFDGSDALLAHLTAQSASAVFRRCQPEDEDEAMMRGGGSVRVGLR